MDLPHVLIIDDEPDLGEILADYLQGSFISSVFSDPEEAIEKIKSVTFNLIVSDMNMPGADGMKIIQIAKEFQPATPVVILTGNSPHDPLIKRAIESGAKGVLTKPFAGPEAVTNHLKNFLTI